LNPALAESIGVDTNNLLLSQRDCAEQALGLVGTLIRSGSVDVVVVDSAGAGGWSWNCVREKHCYLAGGWRLELERCEREIL